MLILLKKADTLIHRRQQNWALCAQCWDSNAKSFVAAVAAVVAEWLLAVGIVTQYLAAVLVQRKTVLAEGETA